MSARFHSLGSYLTRDGAQRPYLALLAKPPSAVDRASDAAAAQRRIAADVEYAARYGHMLAIGRGVRENEDTSMSFLASEKGMSVVYVVDGRSSDARLRTLQSYSKAGVEGILAYAGGAHLREQSVARQVEEKITDLAQRLRWPLATLASGPLARHGVALRGLARNTDMSGLVLQPEEIDGPQTLPDLSITARLLAARVEDRPAVLALEGVQSSQRATALALACGYGLVIAPSAAGPTLAPLFEALPADIGEAQREDLAVFLFDEREGNPVGEDAIQASLVLLRRATGYDARFCFQDRPDLPAPRLLWVSAHGSLSAAAWTRLQCLARDGCRVVISGLCLDDSIQERRLASLDIETRVLDTSRRPSTLANRAVLDCSSLESGVACGRGSFTFTHSLPEFDPRRPDALAFARACAERANVAAREDINASTAPNASIGRRLECAKGWIEASTKPVRVAWQTRS